MKTLKKSFFMIVLFIVISVNLEAQIDKTFWFAAPDITSGHTDKPTRFVLNTFDKAAIVTISQPANSVNFTPIVVNIPANSVYTVQFNTTAPASTTSITFSDKIAEIETKGNLNLGDLGIDNSGILIQSTEIISGYYEVAGGGNDDLYSLKGSNALGTKFIVTTQMIGYNASNWDSGDTRARNRAYIVATENNTSVTITPRSNLVGGALAGTPFTVILQKGEVYVITADNTWAACCGANVGNGKRGNQLGGTIVTSNKPIAISISDDSVAHDIANGTGADLNGDQLIPTTLAGKEFITSKGNLSLNSIGSPANKIGMGTLISDVVHVYPINAGTSITVNGSAITGTKGPGGVFIIENATGAALSITSTDSVLVYQLGGNSNGAGSGNESGGGVIPQLTCSGSQTVSIVRSGGAGENFLVTVLVKTTNINNFTANNNTANALIIAGFTPVAGTNFSVSTVDLAATIPISGVLKVSNSGGLFHLGVTSGSSSGVTRVGYFSNFGSVSGEIQNLGTSVCENGKARLEVAVPGGATAYQWSRNGIVLPEFTGDSVLTCRSGNYKVVATTNSGCNGTFEYPLSFSRCRYACVDKLRVSLNGKCQDTLQLIEAVLPSDCLEAPDYYLVVNDNNPANGAVIDGISPVDGWTYGVFLNLSNGGTELICQGRVIVTDDMGPIFTPEQRTAWNTIDTVVTWADNVGEIVNNNLTWWGNSNGYHLPPTFSTADKYYMGRPYMTDSCEINNCGAMGTQGTWLIDKDSTGSSSLRDSFQLYRSCNLQYKVTDYLENPQCDSTGFQYKLRRSFQIIDQRGNDTVLNQIIYFKRPDLRKSNTNRFTREYALATEPLDRGPGNLGQFGPFGNGPRKAHAHYGEADNLPAGGLIDFRDRLGADQMATTNYSLYADTISYDMSLGNCSSFDAQTDLRPLLTALYVAVDTLPSGRKDSISLFSDRLASNYSVSYSYKEFAMCNQGKKYEVITTVNDWCTGLMERDTLILKIMDQSAPVFETYQAGALGGTIKGKTYSDRIVMPLGASDCSGILRLPAKSGVRTNLRDLSSLFNWGVYDKCSGGNTTTDRNGSGVTLNYKFESRDVWNDRFFTDRGNYTSVNYTLSEMNGGLVALGLPIGEHRLIIEAWDGCNNEKKDTLYFDVQDKTPPVMICKDQVNVTLTSNSTGNYYLRNSTSNRELLKDQNARVWVKDVNKGSRDNCTLDSIYIRRRIDWNTCGDYLKWNMEYDLYGNNNGLVDELDFEAIPGSTLRYTPRHLQYIELFCCDGASGSQVMYELWGSDVIQGVGNNGPTGRNQSYCWGVVQLEDKTPPVITTPDLNKWYNATATNWVNCTEKEIIGTSSNTDGSIANESISNRLFGFPDIYGLECKGSVSYSVTKALICDTGTIIRKWVVTKPTGDGISVTVSATQTIYVRAQHNFSITVPVDQSATCSGKNGTDLIVDEVGCDLLAVSYSERKYDAAPGDNFCYKVYRTGTVINWCMVPNYFSCFAADPSAYAVIIPRNTGTNPVTYTFTLGSAETKRSQTALEASAAGSDVLVRGGAVTAGGEYLIQGTTTASGFVSRATSSCYTKPGFAYQYTQVIKVTDEVRPVVASGNDWIAATSASDVSAGINWNGQRKAFSISGKTGTTGCVAKVKLSFAASDVCTKANLELKKTELLEKGKETNTKGGTLITGTAATMKNGLFTVELSDVPVGEYDLRVTVRDDCGNVTVSRLTFEVADLKAPAPVCVQNLTASLMPDGAGGCMVVLNAKDVFQDINRNWDLEECTTPVSVTIVRVINGAEGTRAATLTLTEADKDGVIARVYLEDGAGNKNYCTVNIFVEDHVCKPSASATVVGVIQTEGKTEVEGVQVNLSGESQKQMATGVNGRYVFLNLNNGMDYTVTPSLNKGFLNGVSTYDLILISKHILGVQPLNTPYKLIAADVNNSKSITTLDLIQLRKLILNIDAAFPSNISWRFVDASYTFPNAANPWAASFPEVKNVNDLTGSLSANFVAIKVGDVNGNAIANSTQGSVRHLTSNLGINVADMNLVAGNEYKVDFTAADLNGIEGFQFTLNLDKKGLELVDLVPGIAVEENFGIFAEEGVVTASWNGEAKGGVLFSLVVRAKSNTTLSEVLNLNSRYTAAEAYKGGEVVNVGLNFNASKASANYELYQNTPNPFAGETIIGFNLPAAGAATLTIQDVTGRTLKVINGQYAKGYNQVNLKSKELAAKGVLTYTLKAADYTMTRKMIVVE